MQRIELLAPARDLKTGLAAINCGADAVYLGATQFGARESAGNPLDTIEQLAAYAHKYWAKVYVTINTLLQEDEVPQAVTLINQLVQAGIDAVIIQDTALLECDLPPIPLFASTQMHNHTPERVAFLEKAGVQRVILARELTLEQIRAIRSATKVELECFIHGALCVSYSGQCYMSYALGGRSGNRGQCAQPCRRLYSLQDRSGKTLIKNRYLLSLHDLNLSSHLGSLLSARVSSFKIEGRLKDTAYVMNTVSHYRRLLDEIFKNGDWIQASSGHPSPDFTPDPARTFNRGFSSYFLLGRGTEIASPDTPKSTGEQLGRIAKVYPNSFSLDAAVELHPGDGLCFFDHQNNLTGTTVYRVQEQQIFPEKMQGLAPGVLVYRNLDHEFIARLAKSRVERKIPISLRLEETAAGLALWARDEDGIEGMAESACEKIAPEKPDQALAAIHKQLNKLGGTEFECVELHINLPAPYFIPLATLNTLRRSVVEQLSIARGDNRPQLIRETQRGDFPYPQTDLTFTGNVLNSKAEAFYRRHGVTHIEPAAETGLDLRGRKVMTTKLCLKYELNACHIHPAPALPHNPATPSFSLEESLVLVDEQGNRFPVRFNCKACEMEVYLASSPG